MATTCFGRQQWGGEMLRAAEGCTSVEAHRDAFSSTQSWRLGVGSRLVGVHVSTKYEVASGHFPISLPHDIKCF